MSILGSLPDSGQLNVASQMVWVGILLEIVEESILLPLYFCFGNSIKDPIETKNKIKTGFIVAIIVYSTFSASRYFWISLAFDQSHGPKRDFISR